MLPVGMLNTCVIGGHFVRVWRLEDNLYLEKGSKADENVSLVAAYL